MARPFGFPIVAALEVGQVCFVPPGADIKRKIKNYAARNNKRFALDGIESTPEMGGLRTTQVTRLPDPEPRAE